MFKLVIEILVEIFIPKKNRADVKHKMLGLPNLIQLRKKAEFVGEKIKISGLFPTRVNKYTSIGDYTTINGLVVYGNGQLKIGKYVHIGSELVICTDNHNYEGNSIPYDETTIKKPVIIEDFVWIGTRVTILPGTIIKEGAIIQAGAVVHGEIPPYAIAGGNPAKVFKYRDIEHFKKLKNEGKYF